jgi:DNA polymerase-3 subunit epsilon
VNVYLDTETTGFSAANGDTIVEIAIVDHNGRPLIDTLVNPQRAIPWQATKVHGIRDDMVRGKPTLGQILPDIRNAIRGKELVIYNASFDVSFFANRLADAAAVRCAMKAFNAARGGRPHKLATAAEHVGHAWSGTAHRALADALACRSVWEWVRRKNQPPIEKPFRSASPPGAPPQSEASQHEVVCLRCNERYPLSGRSQEDPRCPNCLQVFREESTDRRTTERGGKNPSNPNLDTASSNSDPPQPRPHLAPYRSIGGNPPMIVFTCNYCRTEGVTEDSHLVRCRPCNRWISTR